MKLLTESSLGFELKSRQAYSLRGRDIEYAPIPISNLDVATHLLFLKVQTERIEQVMFWRNLSSSRVQTEQIKMLY